MRSRKDEEQHGLQRTLDSLLPRISDMSEEEYGRMKRLQELHDTLRHSPESLLRPGAVLRTGGALLLSVLTILLTALAEEWVPAFMRSLGG